MGKKTTTRTMLSCDGCQDERDFRDVDPELPAGWVWLTSRESVYRAELNKPSVGPWLFCEDCIGRAIEALDGLRP